MKQSHRKQTAAEMLEGLRETHRRILDRRGGVPIDLDQAIEEAREERFRRILGDDEPSLS